MGESYRGLTIRIGGDTSDLQRALRDVNAAASDTQAQLRRISKGLRADPGSAGLANLQLEKTANLAQDAASRLATLRRAEAQVRGTEVARLADATENAARRAERAKKAYNEVDAELERVNSSFREMAQAANYQTAVEDNAALARELHRVGVVSDEAYEKYRRLASAHGELQRQLETAKGAAAYKDLKVELEASRAEVERLKRSMIEARRGSDAGIPEGMREARAAIERTEAAAQGLEREMREVSEGLRMDPGSADLMSRKAENLAEQMRLAKEQADGLREAMRTLDSATGVGKVTRSTRELRDEVARCEERWADVRVRVMAARDSVADLRAEQQCLYLKGDLGERYRKVSEQASRAEQKVAALAREEREASRALDLAEARAQMRELGLQAEKAEAKARGLRGELSAMGRGGLSGIASAAQGISAAATGAIAAVGYKAAESAERIDGAFRDMKKTVDGTEEEFAALRQSALDFASTHPVSADTILEIEALGGQLGIAVDELEAFAGVVSNLDIATNMDAEDIATAMGQLRNVMHWGEGDFERFGDALVRLGNNMPAQEDAIVNITKRIGAAGSMYGFTTPQVLAWSTAIASTGQNCEAAGTAVSNTMSMMEQAVAAGGEDLEAWASVAQMSADEFARAWNTDPSGAFQRFIQGLADIEANGGSAEVALTKLGINGVRQKQALKGLTQTLDVLNDALVMSDDAWNGRDDRWGDAGDAMREAGTKAEGFSGAIQVLRNNVDELAMSLGEAALPFIKAATDLVRSATDAFQGLPPEVQSAAVAVAGMAACAGPLSMLATGIGKVSGKVPGLVGKLKGASTAAEALGKVSGVAKAGLVGLAVAGVAYLAGKLYEGWKRSEEFRAATEGLVDAVNGAPEAFSKAYDGVGEFSVACEESAASVDELIRKQAELADTISKRWSEAASDSALVESYAKVIYELGDRSDLTAQEVERLKLAVEAFNDEAGTSYAVAQDAEGAYRVMSDGAAVAKESVSELVRSMQLAARTEVLTESYKDLFKQNAEALEAQAAAQQRLNEARAAYDEYASKGWSEKNPLEQLEIDRGLHEAQRELEQANGLVESSAAALYELEDQLVALNQATAAGATEWQRYAAQNTYLASALAGVGLGLVDFADAMDQAGVSTELFQNLTNEQISLLVAAYADGTGDMIATLQDFSAQLAESGQTETAAMVDGYVAQLQEMAAQTVDQTAQAVENLEGGLQEGVGPAGEAGSDSGEAYDEGFGEWGDDVYETGSGLSDAGVEGLGSGTEGAYQVGYNFSAGFAEGISSGRSLAVNAAAEVARSAVASAKAEGQVRSPSRVMRSIGGYFSQGFALGVRDGAGDVAREAARMARAAESHASAAASVSGDHGTYRAAAARGAAPSLTKADLYDAVSAAVKSAGEPVFELNVDGRRLTGAIAGHMESALGAMSVRSYR